MSSRRLALEALVAAALVVVAFWYGRLAYRTVATTPVFYQSEFAPAVMVALGRGFQNVDAGVDTPLSRFLTARADALDPRELASLEIVGPDQFQYATRYLLVAVGTWWRMVGISWTAVGGLAALLHVMAVLGAYALFRLFLPLLPSAVGALWMCTSTMQLAYVAQIRDYSKGAFILAAVPFVVVLALRDLPRAWLLCVAAAAGVVIGIGIGFKMDVAVMAPIAVACLILFRGRRPWSGLGDKALAAIVLVLALSISAAPIFYNLSGGGSNAFHVILLGYADQFDRVLGIRPPLYRFLRHYSDGYLSQVVIERALSHTGRVPFFPSAEYDQASLSLWLEIVRHFPADIFARMLAAVNGILNLLFVNPAQTFLTAPLPAQDTFTRSYLWLHQWNGWGALVGATLVVVASLSNLRVGLFAGFLLLALAGYPSLQFDARHYFHLQFIPVVAVLVLLMLPWRGIKAVVAFITAVRGRRARRSDRLSMTLVRHALGRFGVAVGSVVIMTTVPLVALRMYQGNHVRRMLSEYISSAPGTVDIELVRKGNNLWLARWPYAGGYHRPRVGHTAAYYLVEFRSDGPPGPIAIGLRYGATPGGIDASRVLMARSGPGIVRFGFGVFGVRDQWQFEGIELGSGLLRRLIGIRRMDAGPAGLPLDLTLPADWLRYPWYQQLEAERAVNWSDPSPISTLEVSGDATHADQVAALDRFWTQNLAPDPGLVDRAFASTVNVTPAGMAMDGLAESRASFLLQLKSRVLSTGDALVAEGHLDEGGLSVGLLQDGRWHGNALVQQPGDFAVVVPVKVAGTYVAAVQNAMPGRQLRNKFVITRLGIATGEPAR